MASPATDQRERVAVVDRPATTVANENPSPSLKARLAAIRDECFGIGKEDVKMQKEGKSWTIKGHTVEAILSEIRPLFARHGVDMTPSLIERTYTGNRCDVIVDFTFERTDDSDETRVIRWAGAGTDNGDKAFAKAGTNALKEMLKKRFLVTDRDDAKEETESVEHQTDDGASRKALARAVEERRAAVEQWAKTFKAALENCGSADDLARLKRENREQLASDDLPAVTREFFFNLIKSRAEELGE